MSKNKTVLITRPKDSAEYLKNKLESLNYTVLDVPCLEVEYFTRDNFYKYNTQLVQNPVIPAGEPGSSRIDPGSTREALDRDDTSEISNKIIQSSEIIIFVSINAVRAFFNIFKNKIGDKTKLLAIGSKTAKYLEGYNFTNIIYPESEFEQNSEDFVNLPVLQNINKANIILVRGDKSREYIAKTLQVRKANLIEFIVYKTRAPENLEQKLAKKLATTINFEDLIITVTSVSILDNLYASLNNIKKASLLVASDRIAKVAISYGFNKNNIYISNTMNEDSIIDIIKSIDAK